MKSYTRTFQSLVIVLSLQAHADDAKDHLIKAIQTPPKCNEQEVGELATKYSPDADAFLEAAKFGCLGPIIKAAAPTKPPAEDHQGRIVFFKIMSDAEKRYLDFLNGKFFPSAKASLKAGNSPWVVKDAENVANALGNFASLSKTACEATVVVELKESEACKQKTNVDAAYNELTAINNQDTERKKKLAGNSGAEAKCGAGDQFACAELDKKDMHGVSRPFNWRGVPAAHYYLTQLIDGFAVFAEEGPNPMLIAVKQSSLKSDLHPGTSLVYLQELSDGKADCLKFLSEGTGKNQAGFPIPLMRFTAVKCPAKK